MLWHAFSYWILFKQGWGGVRVSEDIVETVIGWLKVLAAFMTPCSVCVCVSNSKVIGKNQVLKWAKYGLISCSLAMLLSTGEGWLKDGPEIDEVVCKLFSFPSSRADGDGILKCGLCKNTQFSPQAKKKIRHFNTFQFWDRRPSKSSSNVYFWKVWRRKLWIPKLCWKPFTATLEQASNSLVYTDQQRNNSISTWTVGKQDLKCSKGY